jgi:hypothetical protein
MMATRSLSPPATPFRRVLEVIGNVAEMETTGSIVERSSPDLAPGATDFIEFSIRSTQKVIDHYRHVMTKH